MSLFSALTVSAVLILGAAEQSPSARSTAPSDSRLRVIDYDPDRITRIIGVPRTATQVQFAADETILNVALGDTEAWEVAVEENLLFLKPRPGARRTNLIATTRRPDGRRVYHFDLSTAAKDAAPVFAIRFRYPADWGPDTGLDLAARALERRILELKLDRAVVEGDRNLAYVVRGDVALQPSEVSDNGRFTVLRFPGNQPLPAIYQITESGDEALVPFDVRGEFLVLHAVVGELRLRRGKAVLCITNQAYDPSAPGTGTGTAASDVLRTDKGTRP